MVIAIDGPGGVGKSTVTRRLATVLGLDFLDTGATYRAAAVAALESGVDFADEAAVLEAVVAREIAYEDGVILLDGKSVADQTRSEAVTQAVTPYPPWRRCGNTLSKSSVTGLQSEAVGQLSRGAISGLSYSRTHR